MNANKRSEKFSTNWIIFLLITLVAVMIAGAVLIRGRVDGGGSGELMTAGIGGGTSHYSNISVTGDVAVGDDMTVAGDLDVTGVITASTLITETTDLSLTGDLTVADVATIEGMEAAYITGTVSGTIPDWTVSDDLTVTDDTSAGGLMTIGEYVIYSEQTVVVCTEAQPITPTGTYQPITSTAAITTSTTCAVYSGTVAGQVVWIVNENASHAIIVDDGANTDLGGNVTLGAGDILKLLWDGANWLGLGTANN